MNYNRIIIKLRDLDPSYSTVDDNLLADDIDQALEDHGIFKDLKELSEYLLTYLI